MNAPDLMDRMFDGWKQHQQATHAIWSAFAGIDPRAPLNETVEKQLAISKVLVESTLDAQSRFTRIAFDGIGSARDTMLPASEWRELSKSADESARLLADSYFAARGKLWSVWLSSLEGVLPAVAENWHTSMSAAAKAWEGTVARTLAGRTATLEESILEGTAPESAKESRGSRKGAKESPERAVA
jgi:hypothetical protein